MKQFSVIVLTAGLSSAQHMFPVEGSPNFTRNENILKGHDASRLYSEHELAESHSNKAGAGGEQHENQTVMMPHAAPGVSSTQYYMPAFTHGQSVHHEQPVVAPSHGFIEQQPFVNYHPQQQQQSPVHEVLPVFEPSQAHHQQHEPMVGLPHHQQVYQAAPDISFEYLSQQPVKPEPKMQSPMKAMKAAAAPKKVAAAQAKAAAQTIPKLAAGAEQFIQKKVSGATGALKKHMEQHEPKDELQPQNEQPQQHFHPPIAPPPAGTQTCWLKTRFRDIGQMVSECGPGLEKASDLCYPKCKEGYQGVNDYCWSKCPQDYKSNGAYCQKPNSIGRGWGSQKMCKNCEKFGLLWYPKCPEGYHSEGCCLCQKDCPVGLGDVGQMCAKDNYSRPNPHPMVCPVGKEQEGFMCYDPCGAGQSGSHNVCWGQCPLGTEQCGVLCLKQGETCTAYLASIGKDTLTSALAQQEQMQGRKRGQMSNDMLATLQADTYNNQLSPAPKSSAPPKSEKLAIGPGLEFLICGSFM